MSKLKAKQTPEGFILEEVNPYEQYVPSFRIDNCENILWEDFESSKKSYATDDPDLIEGVIVDSDDYNITWQCDYLFSEKWVDTTYKASDYYPTRLFARKKVKGEEKETPSILETTNFWKRLELFVKDIQVNDPMSEEEKEYILMTCKQLKQ